MSGIAQNREVLTKRLRRFFEDVPEERKSLLSFINSLTETGAEVFVFGGLIRDLCLKGIESFRSDIDIVVRIRNQRALEQYISAFRCNLNRFGGYRITLSNWHIDLWQFENTWAFSKGLIEPLCKHSLLETTFFNWDASFYDFSNQKLYCPPNYFSNMANRILDVNLEDNPNKYGAFIRTLRFISRENAYTGKKLSEFVINFLKHISDEEILSYEKIHFNYQLLNKEVLEEIRSKIATWNHQEIFSWIPEQQLELFGREDFNY